MMLGRFFGTLEAGLITLSLFSLGWFLVGVFAGWTVGIAQRGGGRSGSGRGRRGNGRVEIYVGNLSYDMTEKDMAKAFGNFGEVLSARIIQNKFNGKSKGFGFVEMPEDSDYASAIRALNGKDIKGRRIVVNEAKNKAQG